MLVPLKKSSNAPKRRLKACEVVRLSLCKRGKNQLPVLLKSDGTVEIDFITKQQDIEGVIYGIAWPAELADSDGDISDRTVCKAMAHSFMRNGGQLDIEHDGKPVGRERAYVVENWIGVPNDPRLQGIKKADGTPVDPDGAWAVGIKLDDEKLLAAYRSGEWNGLSLEGRAEVEAVKAVVPAATSNTTAAPPTPPSIPTKETMNEELLKAINEAVATALKAAGVGTGQPPAAPAVPTPPPIPAAPVAKSDSDKGTPAEPEFEVTPAALRKRAAELTKHNPVLKQLALECTDPDLLLQAAERLEKSQGAHDPFAGMDPNSKAIAQILKGTRSASEQPSHTGRQRAYEKFEVLGADADVVMKSEDYDSSEELISLMTQGGRYVRATPEPAAKEA